MPDTFAITIIFIVLATVIAAFVRKRSRDKCLKDFSQSMVALEDTGGKTIYGKLRVENTGLEFVYRDKHKDEEGHNETSYILYKYEYPNIAALIRFHDELSESGKKKREKELKRTYHPTLLLRLKRKMQNVFKTVKDSVMEVVNMLISQAKGKIVIEDGVKYRVIAGKPYYHTKESMDVFINGLKEDEKVGLKTLELLEKYKDKPFFFFVHFAEV
ncbi:unnamed protein product, partial [marine sediment metagenome]